jgi:hypothetical protein
MHDWISSSFDVDLGTSANYSWASADSVAIKNATWWHEWNQPDESAYPIVVGPRSRWTDEEPLAGRHAGCSVLRDVEQQVAASAFPASFHTKYFSDYRAARRMPGSSHLSACLDAARRWAPSASRIARTLSSAVSRET